VRGGRRRKRDLVCNGEQTVPPSFLARRQQFGVKRPCVSLESTIHRTYTTSASSSQTQKKSKKDPTKNDSQPKHLALRRQPAKPRPPLEREPQTPVGRDEAGQHDEGDQDPEVRPPHSRLEFGPEEGAEDAGEGGEDADEDEGGGGH
jgi:hypothetical protein